jgi:glycine cleavage system aminomethyltransferase T
MIQAASLEQKLRGFRNPVDMLRNSQSGPYVFPIQPEFSNWRDEQESWQKTAVLFDQSFHMPDLYVRGPDTVRLLSDLGVNTFKNFRKDVAKQFVAVNHDGYVIGDAIVFGLEDDSVNIVGRPPAGNWVEFHARSGKYDVEVERDERSLSNPKPRKTFRYEVQGPNAWAILEKANGGKIDDIKFFRMGVINVAGLKVRALRHGMSGAPGLELWGPWEDARRVKDALLEAGKDLGLKQGGARAYSTVAIESAWIPSPMPAIYSGETMKSYREWLPATGFEANASLGGSFVSDNVEDYYLTPWDLGYGGFVNFDHDFIGRDALMKRKDVPHRKKVSLRWNEEDVLKIFGSMFETDKRAKYMDLPAAHYATLPYDAILKDGAIAGISTYPVYTSNGRCWISLSMIDEAHSATGTEVSVLWGEPDGGTSKPTVERHIQTMVRATVEPAPFSKQARETYRPHVLKL